MNNFTNVLLLIIISIGLTSCKSCSRSGRAELRRERSYIESQQKEVKIQSNTNFQEPNRNDFS